MILQFRQSDKKGIQPIKTLAGYHYRTGSVLEEVDKS